MCETLKLSRFSLLPMIIVPTSLVPTFTSSTCPDCRLYRFSIVPSLTLPTSTRTEFCSPTFARTDFHSCRLLLVPTFARTDVCWFQFSLILAFPLILLFDYLHRHTTRQTIQLADEHRSKVPGWLIDQHVFLQPPLRAFSWGIHQLIPKTQKAT